MSNAISSRLQVLPAPHIGTRGRGQPQARATRPSTREEISALIDWLGLSAADAEPTRKYDELGLLESPLCVTTDDPRATLAAMAERTM